jgi:hypothetical protein
MTRYIIEPIPVDRGAVRSVIDDEITTAIPGLEIPPGSALDVMVDTFAGASAEDRQLFTDVLAIIFRYSGEKIDKVTQNAAIAATGVSTWTRTSADEVAVGARTVLAGTEISVTGLDGEPFYFQTDADFTFADGVLTTSSGAVGLIATIAGEDGNGLQAGAQPSETLPWLDTITLTAPTSGGVDAEDDDDYLDRLADTRPLRATSLLLPEDFGRFARNQSGIDRALVLDDFNGTTTQAGHITVIPIDSDGAALAGGDMTTLQTAIEAATATGLLVHVIAPTYTAITVVFTGQAVAGWDPDDVEDRAEQAVLDFLDPARWGLPQSGDERAWIDTPTVRFQDVSAVLNGVEGFDYWTALTVNGSTSDVAMTTPGALPDPASTASGTVTL